MRENLHFIKAKMPPSRTADFQLSCLDGSVFIDFNLGKDQRIYLKRISFDGYGCYNLSGAIKSLNDDDSSEFIKAYQKSPMNHAVLDRLLRLCISLNSDKVSEEPIKEYDLNIQ